MVDDWIEVTTDDIKASTSNALATGPFGSAISSKFFQDSGIPVIRGSNLSEKVGIRLSHDKLVFVSREKAKEFHRSIVRRGDLIFTCWGTIGQVGLIDDRCSFTEYVISNKQMKLTPDPKRVDSLFLYYLFSGPDMMSMITGQAIGSSVPGFNLGQLRELRFRLPPLPEQRAIAHILGALDDKIEMNRRMNQTLEGIARAIFKSWFVDFDPVWAKAAGRQPPGLAPHIADLFPDAFEESESGETPKGWETWSVADVGDVICGKTPSTKSPEYYGNDVPFIRIPDMHAKIFATETQKMLSLAGVASQENKTLPAGSICVSCIATPGLVIITTQESQTNQQINSVIPKSPDETYFWYWTFLGLRDEIEASGSGGSVVTNLSTGRFSQLRIQSTSADLRRSYSTLVRPLFERILSNDKESSTLAALRDTLLPKLISGELRVPDAERIVGRCT